VIKPEKEP